MSARVYTFVDGESHFCRAQEAWHVIHGQDVGLERVRHHSDPQGLSLLCVPPAKVFWMTQMTPDATRVYYFTATSGDASNVHQVKCRLRAVGLEPEVVHESRPLADRRKNVREHNYLIEKAKGVDIALAVKMLESRQHFDVCHLFTSDIDFLPAIDVLRADGKHVYVHGFENGLGHESDFLHACNQFIDLSGILRDECFASNRTTGSCE